MENLEEFAAGLFAGFSGQPPEAPPCRTIKGFGYETKESKKRRANWEAFSLGWNTGLSMKEGRNLTGLKIRKFP